MEPKAREPMRAFGGEVAQLSSSGTRKLELRASGIFMSLNEENVMSPYVVMFDRGSLVSRSSN